MFLLSWEVFLLFKFVPFQPQPQTPSHGIVTAQHHYPHFSDREMKAWRG